MDGEPRLELLARRPVVPWDVHVIFFDFAVPAEVVDLRLPDRGPAPELDDNHGTPARVSVIVDEPFP